MIDRYVVDFNKTFGGAMLLRVEPKMARADKTNPNSEQKQATDKDGLPRWTVTLSVETKSFGKTKLENIEITVTSPNKPYGAISKGTDVTVEGLELGIMPQTREKGGFSIFYSAEAIRPLQPTQPARAASGQ